MSLSHVLPLPLPLCPPCMALSPHVALFPLQLYPPPCVVSKAEYHEPGRPVGYQSPKRQQRLLGTSHCSCLEHCFLFIVSLTTKEWPSLLKNKLCQIENKRLFQRGRSVELKMSASRYKRHTRHLSITRTCREMSNWLDRPKPFRRCSPRRRWNHLLLCQQQEGRETDGRGAPGQRETKGRNQQRNAVRGSKKLNLELHHETFRHPTGCSPCGGCALVRNHRFTHNYLCA